MVASQTPKIRRHKRRRGRRIPGSALACWNFAFKDGAGITDAARGASTRGSIATAAAINMRRRFF